jgi:pyruvate/2-oxoglutarate dehydrogenase complex dihydrolipoamide acyltransferase (E2) component
MQPRSASAVRRETLSVPECGVVGVPLRLSLWLVPEGTAVTAGDRVVELVAGGATIDLEAPITGRLLRQLAEEDDPVAAGMPIAEFEAVA